ncbi:MAG: hypothetical protein DRP81_07915, partial [Candidatus Omnitrophota bacterium]
MIEIIRIAAEGKDPDEKRKNQARSMALKLKDTIRDIIDKSDDSLEIAAKISALGNALDFNDPEMSKKWENKEINLDELLEEFKWARNDIEQLKSKMEKGEKTILWVFDNAGEDVLDIVSLIFELLKRRHKIILAGKTKSAGNDTTKEDLEELCKNEVIKELLGEYESKIRIIDTGSICLGTDLMRVSNEFVDAWQEADFVIFKGQGNYLTVRNFNPTKDSFFILRVKWEEEVKDKDGELQYSRGDYVLEYADSQLPVAVGVDLGGTKIASAVFDSAGRLVEGTYSEIPTGARDDKEAIIENILRQIRNAIEKSKVEISAIRGIAIASPGPLDPIKGVIKNPPNLPGLKNLPLVEILKQRLEKEYGRSFDVFLQHDAAATALGEALFGAGKEFKSFHFMTISTGIGSGIIRNGQIYYGEDGKQFDIGETGMMKGLDPDRPHLNLMQLASGLAIAEEARKAIEKGEKELLRFAEDSKIENITAKTVSEAAKQNNKTAREIIQRAGRYIGLRLVKLIEEGEEHFVLGGGVVKIGPLFINAIKEEIKKHKPTFNTEDNIKIAILGAQAGMLGAISSISHFLVLGAERIGITGGTGSIGSQFIKWLLKRRGSYIDVLVRSLNDRARIRLPLSDFRIRVKQADLLDIEELEKFVIDNDIIFHLAAWSKSGVDISIEEALLVNCISTAFLTQLANKYNKRLVFTSSVVVYRLSQNREGALKENSLILPDNIESFVTRAVEEFGLYVEEVLNKGRINRDEAISFIQNFLRKNPLPQNVDLYGLTKIIGERIVLKYDNSICFRLADVYGPGDETKRIIPTIFKSVLQDMKECQVKDDAKQFIYIDDVLEVLELAIEVKLEEESRIINVPGSKLIRTVEIAEIIKRLANSNIKIVPIPSQSPTIEMDSALLREKFGIIPTTSFDEGIKKTYKWWIEQIASLQKEPTHYLQILIASSEEANKILPRELKKKENLRDEMSKNSKGGGSSHRDKLSAIDCDDAYLLSRFKNNLKIREYIKDLMC